MAGSAAVIGAGLAGLACARRLNAAGFRVLVFDKGRGPGGRMSTRRVETPLGEARFDHGAQFFTARDPGFRTEVERLTQTGAVALWEGRLVSLDAAGAPSPLPAEARFVGAPGMNAVVRALADGLDVAWGVRVQALARGHDGWRLTADDGSDLGTAEIVVCAVPAEQAAALLADAAPALAREAAAARTAPCWAGLYALETPLGLDFDGAKLAADPLAWAARDRAKPGRAGPQTWVLHASPGWSAQHLEDDPGRIAGDLWAAFGRAAGVALPAPAYQAAHRWRYAQVVKAVAAASAYDADRKIAACGDWRIGARVEAAWLSGDQTARAIIASRPTTP